MFTDGFNTEVMFTSAKTGKRSELNRYCKLEGMDYQQMVSEAQISKSLLSRKKHSASEDGSRGHTH